jgi:hypothetical protein
MLKASEPGIFAEVVFSPTSCSADRSAATAAALAIAGAVPAAWTLARFAWRRRLDPVGVLAVGGFSVALLVAALAGGNPLLLKVRDAPLIGVIGVAFLLSAAVRKPALLHLLGRDRQVATVLWLSRWRTGALAPVPSASAPRRKGPTARNTGAAGSGGERRR